MRKLILLTLLLSTSVSAAITLDATSTGGYVGSGSTTWNHTCTGSNLILVVGVWSRTSDGITGVTYNGTALTLATKITSVTAEYAYLYYLVGPNTGTHPIIVSGTSEILGSAISYAGVSQTAEPDAVGTNGTTSTDFTASVSLTTVADGSWMVGLFSDSGAGGFNSPNGTTLRVVMDGDTGYMFDTNGPISPPGATTMTLNHGADVSYAAAAMSIAPAAAGSQGGPGSPGGPGNPGGPGPLSITSASVAGDGRTFTVNMSAGSLSPASGITGCFTLHGSTSTGLNAPSVGAATTSGSTVTFMSSVPFEASDTVTIDIATASGGCSLASGTNTPQGQSSVAVTNNSEWHGCANAPMNTFARYEGSPTLNVDLTGEGFAHMCTWNSSGGAISVNATGSEVQVWTWQYGTGFKLYQDGVAAGAMVNGDSTGTFKMTSLATGLSGTHLYRIVAANATAPYQNYLLAMVRFVGGGPTGTAPAGTVPLLSVCGDSNGNFTGGGSAPPDMTTYDWFLATTAAGGVAQGWTLSGQDEAVQIGPYCANKLVPLGGQKSNLIVHTAGGNDAHNKVPLGNGTTAGTFIGDMVADLTSTAATDLLPGGANLVREFIPVNPLYVDAATAATYRAAEATAVAYVNSHGGSACLYHTGNWINISNPGPYPADTIDGVHMNSSPVYPDTHAAGKVANLEAPIFYSYLGGSSSYTITGPASVLTGVPATYTVTLAGGNAVFVASPTQTIALNDGGKGGAFYSTFGSGTGSATFTPTSGSSFTFTYTASASGSITLSAASAQDCWKDPASLSITSTVPLNVNQSLSFGPTGNVYNNTMPQSCTNMLEFYLHDWADTGTTHVVYSQNTGGSGANGWKIVSQAGVPGTRTLAVTNIFDSESGGASIPLGTLSPKAIYVRAQKDCTAKQDTVEAWDTMGNRIYSTQWNYYTSDSLPRGSDFWIGAYAGEAAMDLGFMRDSTVLVGSNAKPPTTVSNNPPARLFEWKFDGDLTDSSGNGNAAQVSGAISYVNTPYINTVAVIKTANAPSWANTVSLRAGFPEILDGTSSFSQSAKSNAVSCFWQQLSGPSMAYWSSRTSCTPTLTGLVFGDYQMQLTATDTSGGIAMATTDIGVVATDNNGVVVNADPRVDQIFGNMIAYGQNPWGYADWWSKHAMDLRHQIYLGQGFVESDGRPQWEHLGSGTVSYYWGGVGQTPGNTTNPPYTGTTITNSGGISATALSITVADATKIDFTQLPTRILVGPYFGPTEEVRICSVSGNTLTVCYDGRGANATSWGAGTAIGQFKISGSGTHFLTDTSAPVCPRGAPGPSGPALYTDGGGATSVSLTAGSTVMTTTGAWNSMHAINGGAVNYSNGYGGWYGTNVGAFIRVSATHGGGTPFTFIATLQTGGALINPFNVGVTNGAITSVSPYYVGQNYTPGFVTVAVIDPTGSGAVITPNIVGGQITSYTIVNGGSNYSNPTFEVRPTQLTLSRAYPSDADTGTFSSYSLLSGYRTLVLRGPNVIDTSAASETMWNTTGCESETAVYGNPGQSGGSNGLYGTSFGGGSDVVSLDGKLQSGFPYSVTDSTGWVNQQSTGGINFYGESLASRALCYRSGLASACTAARTLDDWLVKSPWWSGASPLFIGGEAIGAYAAAILDTNDPNKPSWSDVRKYAGNGEFYITKFYNGGTPNCQYDDTRNSGYEFMFVILAALFDPDPTFQARWASDLVQLQAIDNVCKGSDNSWANAAYYWGTPANSAEGFGPLTMTNGSTAVTSTGVPSYACYGTGTGTGTVVSGSGNLTVTGGTLPSATPNTLMVVITGTMGGQPFTGSYAYSGSSNPYSLSVLWPGDSGNVTWMAVSIPGGASAGGALYGASMAIGTSTSDPNLSHNYACIYNSPTSITLDHPWQGASGSGYYGYWANLTGKGQQPLMLGIKIYGLGMLARNTSPALSSYATAYTGLDQAATQWMHDTGYDANTLTTNYGRVFGFCEPTTTSNGTSFDVRTPGCTFGASVNGRIIGREQNAETSNAFADYYQFHPTAANQTFGDQLYGAVWGNGQYNTGGVYYDDASVASNPGVGNLNDTAAYGITGGKWYGFFGGIGALHRWPAVRLGGVAPANNRTVYVPFTLAGVTHATEVRLTVTQPTGASQTLVCATSPCAVTLDARAGSVLMKMDYLNASGSVLVSSDNIPLYVPQ